MATLLNRRRYMGSSSLPYDAEVEYLEATGTQYINTGIKPTSTYTFDTTVAVTASGNIVPWGCRSAGNYQSNNSQCYFNTNNNNFRLYTTDIRNSGNWDSGITPTVNAAYKLVGMTAVSTMNNMTYPITLFALNNIGSINSSLGKCRIFRWTAYNNGVIVADFIPVRIGTTGYMYDRVSGNLFGNDGTGNFVLGSDVTPYIYDAEIEYLQSDGNSYIDSGIEATGDLSVEFVGKVIEYDTSAACGCIVSTPSGYFRHHWSPTNSSFYWIQNNNVNTSSINNIAFKTDWYSISIDATNGIALIDGAELTFEPVGSSVKAEYNYGIFARIGEIFQSRKCAFKSFKMTRGGVLVRDFIPVRKGSFGYMYDKISKQLFGSENAHPFILGPDKT